MTKVTDAAIKANLEVNIARWYSNAKEDYDVIGKLNAVNITPNGMGRDIEILFEEDGTQYRTKIWMSNDDPIDYVYNVWMAGNWEEIKPKKPYTQERAEELAELHEELATFANLFA